MCLFFFWRRADGVGAREVVLHRNRQYDFAVMLQQ